MLLNNWFEIGPVICSRAAVLNRRPKAEGQYGCPKDNAHPPSFCRLLLFTSVTRCEKMAIKTNTTLRPYTAILGSHLMLLNKIKVDRTIVNFPKYRCYHLEKKLAAVLNIILYRVFRTWSISQSNWTIGGPISVSLSVPRPISVIDIGPDF